ncbi:hypothetical protein D3C75_1070870 [compost metagenome]
MTQNIVITLAAIASRPGTCYPIRSWSVRAEAAATTARKMRGAVSDVDWHRAGLGEMQKVLSLAPHHCG